MFAFHAFSMLNSFCNVFTPVYQGTSTYHLPDCIVTHCSDLIVVSVMVAAVIQLLLTLSKPPAAAYYTSN